MLLINGNNVAIYYPTCLEECLKLKEDGCITCLGNHLSGTEHKCIFSDLWSKRWSNFND